MGLRPPRSRGRNYAGCWHRTTSGHATEASTSRGSKEPKDTPHTRVGLVLSHHAIRIPCAGGQDRSPNICLCVCRTHGKPVAALDCLEGQARGPHPRREWPPGTCLQSSTTRVTHHRSPCTDRPPRGGPTEPLSSDVPRPPLSVPRACVARVPSPCQQKVTQGEPAAGMAWGSGWHLGRRDLEAAWFGLQGKVCDRLLHRKRHDDMCHTANPGAGSGTLSAARAATRQER